MIIVIVLYDILEFIYFYHLLLYLIFFYKILNILNIGFPSNLEH